MTHGRAAVWLKRIGGIFAAIVLVIGTYAALNWSSLNAKYAAHQFRIASTTEERTAAAVKLAGYGELGCPHLIEPFRTDDATNCAVVADLFAAMSPSDPPFAILARSFLTAIPTFSPVGAEAALPVIPQLLQCPEADSATACRELVRIGLKSPSAEGRVRAVRLAMRPEFALRTETVPLLDDTSAEVRRAAMLAIGPMNANVPVIEDEVLFKWLHDADLEVRDLCASALATRGLDEAQVALARKLSSPSPSDRLSLLMDLRFSRDVIADPGPWLERLSRDADPAVRAGTTRVAFECRLHFAGWADRLADADPDATVRRLAGYYRGMAGSVRQTGFRDE